MTTANIKKFLKLFMLVILVWLTAIFLPTSFAEKTHEEVAQELKVDILEKIEAFAQLDAHLYTTESWEVLDALVIDARDFIMDVMADFDESNTDLTHMEDIELELEIVDVVVEADLEEEMFGEVLVLNLEMYFHDLMAAYENLVFIDAVDENLTEDAQFVDDDLLQVETDEDTAQIVLNEEISLISEVMGQREDQCEIVASDETRVVADGQPGIHAVCLIIEEGVTLTMNAMNLGDEAAIYVTEFVLVKENATLNLLLNGAGHGIDAPEGVVIFAPNSTGNLTRSGGGNQGTQTGGTAMIHAKSLRIEENAHVDVMVTGPGHGVWVTELELKKGTQSVDHDGHVAPWEQNLQTTTLNVISSGDTAGTAVRIKDPGQINLRENARMRIYTGTSTAVETSAGNHGASNGLFGEIDLFNMEANAFLDIEATGVGFRSRNSTTYTMTGGARKNVYTRIGTGNASVGANGAGRSAFVLANRYVTGSGATAGAIENRNNHTHAISLSGEGTILNIEGYPGNLHNTGNSPPNDGRPNRSNMMIYGDHSSVDIGEGAALYVTSHRTTALTVFGEYSTFNVNEGGVMELVVHGSGNADSGAFRFLQSGSQTFNLNGGRVSVLATAGNAGLLRAFGGNNAFYVRNGGLLELIHEGSGPGVDFAQQFIANFQGGMATADRFIVGLPPDDPGRTTPRDVPCRSEVYIRTNDLVVDGAMGTVTANGTTSRNQETITRVEAEEGTVFVVNGDTSGADGIFNAGRLHMVLNSPLFFDFVNRDPGNGVIFNTSSSSNNPSTITGRNTDLALWRNTRSGSNIFDPDIAEGCDLDDPRPARNCLGQDPIDGSPAISMHNTNFYLAPSQDNFANGDLTHGNLTGINGNNSATTTAGIAPSPGFDRGCLDMFITGEGYSNCAFDGFRNWFNGASLSGSGTGSNTGWRQIRRMTANNSPAVIDILRTPTDADQRIFGHVTVQEGNRSARSAHDDEVFVDVEIWDNSPNPRLIQTIYSVPTKTLTVWDSMPSDSPHMGVFEALVDFNSPPGLYCPEGVTTFRRMPLDANDPLDTGEVVVCDFNRGNAQTDPFHLTMTRISHEFPPETTYLPTGYTVRAVEARRTGTAQGRSAGEVGINGITGATPRYRRMEVNLTKDEQVRRVTPPEQVTDVVALVHGHNRFDGELTTATTSLTGTGQPDAWVRLARVNPANQHAPVTNITSWIGEPVQVNERGEWTMPIPTGANLQVGERLSIYISDGELLDGTSQLAQLIPTPVAPLGPAYPEIIYNMDRASAVGLANMANRYQIADIHLPRTTLTQDWSNGAGQIGNMGYHWAPLSANRTEFHDAAATVGNVGFDYAYVLTVNVAPYAEFEFIKRRPLPSVLPIEGAQFNVYHQNEDTLLWEDVPLMSVVSDAQGRIHLTGLSHGGTYRLKEVQAAPGFLLPPADHYWEITVDNAGHVTYVNGTPSTPPIGNIDGELILTNEHLTRDLTFKKVSDLTQTPLPGATFSLYRRQENTTDWTLIAANIKSDHEGIVTLPDLRYGGEYRLMETAPPPAYDKLPDDHYWLIHVALETGDISLPTAFLGAPDFKVQNNEQLILINHRSKVPLFEILKTEADEKTPLAGAAFDLYRFNVAEEDWQIVAELISNQAGVVAIDEVLTYGGSYRLVETEAPSGFRTPPVGHYWSIDVTEGGEVLRPTHHQGAPEIVSCPDDVEIADCLPNHLAQVSFSFIKTEEDLRTPLPRAHFNLYRYLESDANWLFVKNVASDQAGRVTFDGLLPEGTYRLTETQAPPGFITPPVGGHYWLVTVGADGEISVPVAHEQAPAFHICTEAEVRDTSHLACEMVGDFILLNMLYIPLTGVVNQMEMYLIAGLVMSFIVLMIRMTNSWKRGRQFQK